MGFSGPGKECQAISSHSLQARSLCKPGVPGTPASPAACPSQPREGGAERKEGLTSPGSVRPTWKKKKKKTLSAGAER